MMTEFNGRLYTARITCRVADAGTGGAYQTSSSSITGCTDGTTTNRESQLWKCDPSATGGATTCEAADWSIVADGGSGITNFGDTTNRSMTMVVANGSYLYVGFDNANGIEIWRTNTANPGSATTDWEQIGGDGLGATSTMQQIFSAISVQQGSDYYIYLSGGKNGTPISIYRQKNN